MTNISSISVVVPFYNREKTISNALESALACITEHDEVLAIDDGSTDQGLVITRNLATKHPRLRILTQENRGVSAARNNGVKQARSEIILFLDSDDLMLPDALERVREEFKSPIDFCWGSVRLVDAEGKTRIKRYSRALYGINPQDYVLGLSSSYCFAIRKEAFLEEGGFDESLRNTEDTELAIRLRNRPYSIIEQVCFQINTGTTNNQLTRHDKSRIESLKYIYNKHQKFIDCRPAYARNILKSLFKCSLRSGDLISLRFAWTAYCRSNTPHPRLFLSLLLFQWFGYKWLP